jgi:hypothetical protein
MYFHDGPAASRSHHLGEPAPEQFGEPDPLWQRVKLERVGQVVRAIYRLPEGTSAVGPRPFSHEQRIVEKLRRQGFSRDEIEAGLRLTRKELGLRETLSPANIRVSRPDNAPRMGPAEHSPRAYERAEAKHIDQLHRRASMGDQGAADDLAKAINRLLSDRARMARISYELTQLRSPAAIMLRVPPEPPAPTPSPPLRWRLPPRLVPRR